MKIHNNSKANASLLRFQRENAKGRKCTPGMQKCRNL